MNSQQPELSISDQLKVKKENRQPGVAIALRIIGIVELIAAGLVLFVALIAAFSDGSGVPAAAVSGAGMLSGLLFLALARIIEDVHVIARNSKSNAVS
jgi:hypothetical protein